MTAPTAVVSLQGSVVRDPAPIGLAPQPSKHIRHIGTGPRPLNSIAIRPEGQVGAIRKKIRQTARGFGNLVRNERRAYAATPLPLHLG